MEWEIADGSKQPIAAPMTSAKPLPPCYRKLDSGQWQAKLDFFSENFSPCCLCPRQCRSERLQGRPGVCHNVDRVRIASHSLHFGEEPPVSGRRGSGTIFFSGCTLKCLFCQNWPISQLANGKFCSVTQLAEMFLYLQKNGAHNINWVSPTPHLHHAVQALFLASQKGLAIPVVYNTSGYERVEVIRQLDGLVDIYMPDLKYHDDDLACRLSGVRDYVANAMASIAEMFAQTGELKIDQDGVAQRGTIIRHLIIPGEVRNSLAVLQAISQSSFKKSFLSLMSQYFPAHRAVDDPALCRRLSPEEYRQVRDYALELGFEDGWFQDIG